MNLIDLFREARLERQEFHRRRLLAQQYRRWLAEFPDICLVLDNLEAEAAGKSVDICHPPAAVGPWSVENLRAVLREQRTLICYTPCERHQGQTFNMHFAAGPDVAVRKVCPGCEPPTQKRVDNNS